MTCPEATTSEGTAGVGGEKRGRDREGMAESDAGRAEVGEGRGWSGRNVEGLGWGWAGGGAGRCACTGRGAVKEVWDVTKVGAASSCDGG